MKAQMSMEMVIGILILIIVAAVVINMFMSSAGKVTGVEQYQQDMRYQQFVSVCKGLCNDYKGSGQSGSIVKFCSSKISESINKATVRNDVLKAERGGVLPICGDAIYCFHTYECVDPQRGAVEWEDCRTILCNAYYDFYKDWGKASQKVLELYPAFGPDEESRVGSCYNKISKDENWWLLYFAKNGQLPCGGSLPTNTTTTTTTTGTQAGSLSCSVQLAGIIKCQFSACPTTKCYLICSVEGGGSCSPAMQSIEPTEREYIYISMKTGSTYNFNFQDSNFQKIAGPASVTCC